MSEALNTFDYRDCDPELASGLDLVEVHSETEADRQAWADVVRALPALEQPS